MTYEPGRDPQNPLDVDPKTRQYRTEQPVGGVPARSRGGISWMVGVIALLAAAGIIWYGMSDRTDMATNERPAATAPATTGAGETTSPNMGATTPAAPADQGATTTNPPAANPPATPPATRE